MLCAFCASTDRMGMRLDESDKMAVRMRAWGRLNHKHPPVQAQGLFVCQACFNAANRVKPGMELRIQHELAHPTPAPWLA